MTIVAAAFVGISAQLHLPPWRASFQNCRESCMFAGLSFLVKALRNERADAAQIFPRH